MSHKILIVGPAWVGDMVMAQCLFKLIKERHPDVVLDVLAPAWSLPLLQRMPEVSDAIIMPLGHGQFELRKRYQLGIKLRERQYSQAIVLPNSFKSALPLWFAKIPRRTGWRGEMRYIVLNDIRILDKTRYPLMIERFLALGLAPDEALQKPYPIPSLQISKKTQDAALVKHQLTFSAEKPVLALCPGAEFGPAKRWPEEHYAEIANAKLAEGWQVWIFGSPKDREVAERILTLTQGRGVDLTGRTTLEEAVDLLDCAKIVVSNDSGLMHIAAALKKPLIAVYGPTSASFTPPLHDQAKILSLTLSCQPCFQRTCPLKHERCMRDLLPASVLQAMSELC
jgi:heptosyltransferase-2